MQPCGENMTERLRGVRCLKTGGKYPLGETGGEAGGVSGKS